VIGTEFLAVIYGLASAISWGAGDFSGGIATRRNSVYIVVFGAQAVGIMALIIVAMLLAEPFPLARDMLYGGVAGIAGNIGLVALYRGLATGRMGVVAPVAAVVTALVPILAGLLTEGLPATQQITGFGLALTAVWLISRSGSEAPITLPELGLPLLAGVNFGLFFILIDQVSRGAVLWPLVAARLASLFLLLGIVMLTQQRDMPTRRQLPIIILAGLLDTGGNAFFALATQTGRLDISAVLSSLYPASTILLAWLILKERLLPRQWIGVGAALVAVVLIAW